MSDWTDQRINSLLHSMDNIANELYVLNNQTLADITKVVIHPKPPKETKVSHVSHPSVDVEALVNRFDNAAQAKAFMGSDHPDTWHDTKLEYVQSKNALLEALGGFSIHVDGDPAHED